MASGVLVCRVGDGIYAHGWDAVIGFNTRTSQMGVHSPVAERINSRLSPRLGASTEWNECGSICVRLVHSDRAPISEGQRWVAPSGSGVKAHDVPARTSDLDCGRVRAAAQGIAQSWTNRGGFLNSHTRVFLRDRDFAPMAYVAHAEPKRLIVLLHGFLGSAGGTWRGMESFDAEDDFWRSADLLFVGYDSFRESIKGVADRLRRRIPDFYPTPSNYLRPEPWGALATRPDLLEYEELIIVAHSLGGLVARKALLDELSGWSSAPEETRPRRPALLDAQLRLFSPASAGYRPAGMMTILDQIESGLGVMRFSAAYLDLQQDSEFVRSTRAASERLSEDKHGAALRARTLWANPENVVNTVDYDSDLYSQSADGRNHRTVCKPTVKYSLPWTFISTGSI